MKKLESLTDWLKRAVPGVKKQPERLVVRADKGKIVCRGGRSLSFEYRYEVTIGVWDLADPTDSLVLPLLAWISVNEPELLFNSQRREELTFELEPLNDAVSDLVVRLTLCEAVIVSRTAEGGLRAEHLPEPADDDRFDPPLPAATLLRELYLGDDLVAKSAT